MIIRDGPYEQLWAFPCDNSVISVAATPNCSLISAATVGCSVYLLDDEGNLLWKNKEPLDNEGWATALSADGKLVAVGTANKKPSDGAIHVFGSDGSSVWSRRVRAPVWSLSFSADGKTLAAACWNDHLYLCVRSGPGYDVREINLSKHGVTGGLYGVKLSPNGLVCVVAAYDRGLFVFDRDGELLQRVDSNEGLYNITICENTSKIVAGTRGGSFLVCDLENSGPPKLSQRISQRPLCGIAASADGLVVACGSFDGRAVLSTRRGDTLWELETKGEIWSTAMSGDGALVCIGGGDHAVRLIRNHCHSSALQEVQAVEAGVSAQGVRLQSESLNQLSNIYLKYGLVQYRLQEDERARECVPRDPLSAESVEVFLEGRPGCFPEALPSALRPCLSPDGGFEVHGRGAALPGRSERRGTSVGRIKTSSGMLC